MCEVCGGLGEVYSIPAKQYLPCPQCELGAKKRAERAARIAKSAAIPPRYADARLTDLAHLDDVQAKGKRTAYKIASLFVAAPDNWVSAQEIDPAGESGTYNWLVLEGEVGRGKTYLACAILNTLLARGINTRYIRLDDMIAAVISSYNHEDADASRHTIISRLQNVGVLLIDEFTATRVTAHTQEVIESVLRHRHNHHLPTVFTTNHDQSEMFERWGERITTVILSNALWVRMTGSTLRSYPAPFEDPDV